MTSNEIARALHACNINRKSPAIRDALVVTGENPSVGNVSLETVWTLGGIRPKPSAPMAMSAVSSSVDDTNGGAGAEALRVNYLDVAGVEKSATVLMNGTTPVLLPTNVYRVQPSGTIGQKNIGNISIVDTATGLVTYDFIGLDANGDGYGGTHSAAVTVPIGHQGFVSNIFWGTDDNLDTLFVQDIPIVGRRALPIKIQGQQPVSVNLAYPALTDIELQAKSSGGNAALTAIIRIILVSSP